MTSPLEQKGRHEFHPRAIQDAQVGLKIIIGNSPTVDS